MQALQETATRALRELLAAQPLSATKVAFAWRIVAGATLAGASRASWTSDGRLRLRVPADAWRREILRARPALIARLNDLLGADAVTDLAVEVVT